MQQQRVSYLSQRTIFNSKEIHMFKQIKQFFKNRKKEIHESDVVTGFSTTMVAYHLHGVPLQKIVAMINVSKEAGHADGFDEGVIRAIKIIRKKN